MAAEAHTAGHVRALRELQERFRPKRWEEWARAFWFQTDITMLILLKYSLQLASVKGLLLGVCWVHG